MILRIPYGRSYQNAEIPPPCRVNLLVAKKPDTASDSDPVLHALTNPIGSPRLSELAKDRKRIVILSPDHTRPMPSDVTVPALLAELRRDNPSAEVSLIIATGLHRKPTGAELEQRYGRWVLDSVKVISHDPDEAAELEYMGMLPSGAPLYVNKKALEADLLVAESLVEPHFFAGYSGGRKMILPGVAGRTSVYHIHSAPMIGHGSAEAGQLSGNPLSEDMDVAARRSGLAFHLGVCIDLSKNITAAFAGDPFESHGAACRYLQTLCELSAPEAQITVVGNGGYPLDQNLYQAVKGMYTAARVTKRGGVIVMCSECVDGVGADNFRDMVSGARSSQELLHMIDTTPVAGTAMDQWQAQVLAEVLCKCKVILVSENIPEELARSMHLDFAPTLDAALGAARSSVGEVDFINAIPDGVGVVVNRA